MEARPFWKAFISSTMGANMLFLYMSATRARPREATMVTKASPRSPIVREELPVKN
jgi:hypothetical protein